VSSQYIPRRKNVPSVRIHRAQNGRRVPKGNRNRNAACQAGQGGAHVGQQRGNGHSHEVALGPVATAHVFSINMITSKKIVHLIDGDGGDVDESGREGARVKDRNHRGQLEQRRERNRGIRAVHSANIEVVCEHSALWIPIHRLFNEIIDASTYTQSKASRVNVVINWAPEVADIPNEPGSGGSFIVMV